MLVVEGWDGHFMRGNYDGGSGRSIDKSWNCSSIGESGKTPFEACFPSLSYGHLVFIKQSMYDSLSDHDKAVVGSRAQGIVGTGYFETRLWTSPWDGRTYHKKYFVPGAITKCFTNACVVLRPDLTPDPCEDVSCPDKCVGVDKYDQVCQGGICVRGTLIETDSVHCGYTPDPTPDPTPTPPSDTYIIIALMLAGTYILLRR